MSASLPCVRTYTSENLDPLPCGSTATMCWFSSVPTFNSMLFPLESSHVSSCDSRVVPRGMSVYVQMARVAYQHVAILLQLVLVVRDNLVRRVVRLVLQRDDLQPKSESGDVHIRALVAAIRILFS